MTKVFSLVLGVILIMSMIVPAVSAAKPVPSGDVVVPVSVPYGSQVFFDVSLDQIPKQATSYLQAVCFQDGKLVLQRATWASRDWEITFVDTGNHESWDTSKDADCVVRLSYRIDRKRNLTVVTLDEDVMTVTAI